MCRSFLSEWKDDNGNKQWWGRANFSVQSLNLPKLAIQAMQSDNEDKIYEYKYRLREQKELLRESIQWRYNLVKDTKAKNAPILFQHGALTRLKPEQTIQHLIDNGYLVCSVGYIGMNEVCYALTGKSNYENKELALELLQYLKDIVNELKEEMNINIGLYGSPAEMLTFRYAKSNREEFGIIPNVTDRDWLTNSYHASVTEKINVFEKFNFEKDFQRISDGGAISYVEVPHFGSNVEAMYDIIRYMKNNIMYSEVNTKNDICYECDFEGMIELDDNHIWTCPKCGNQNKNTMSVVRRTTGYVGTNFWNEGKTKEIKERVLHL